MKKKILLVMSGMCVVIAGLLCGKQMEAFAQEASQTPAAVYTSSDTGLNGLEQPIEGMECEMDLYNMYRTNDGKAVYYQWLTPRFTSFDSSKYKVYLAVNTLDGSGNKKTRIVKSKTFKKIYNVGFNITRQDKNGNVYDIHSIKNKNKPYKDKKSESLYVYDKKGNCKKIAVIGHNTKKSVYWASDMHIKAGKVYIVFNKYKGKGPGMKVETYNLKNGKRIKQSKLLKDSGSYPSERVKYTDSGLYILLYDRIERYSLDGSKLKNTYMLPDVSKKDVKKMYENLYAKDGYEYESFPRECFSITDSYVYYSNADGFYRADIKGESGLEHIFNAEADTYFAGEYSFYDMVCLDDNTFYMIAGEGPDEPHTPEHIIKYSRQ